MNKAIIISGNLAQDHEFIYPYYRLLEENLEVDVCMLKVSRSKVFLEQLFHQIKIKRLSQLMK